MDLGHGGRVYGDMVDTLEAVAAAWYIMPWPVKDLLTVRLEFVQLALRPDANVRQLCRRFGVSPTVGYRWLERFAAGGEAALADRSRRPGTVPGGPPRRWSGRWWNCAARTRPGGAQAAPPPAGSRTPGAAGPEHAHGDSCTGTAWSVRRRARRPRRSSASSGRARNQLWQVDFKGHFALNVGRCHPLGVLDDRSRYNVLLAACADQREATVRAQLAGAFRGPAPAGAAALGTTVRPGAAAAGNTPRWTCGCCAWGCGPAMAGPTIRRPRARRSASTGPCRPRCWPGAAGPTAQVQRAFDEWRPVYNTQRPHEALALAVPLSRYRPSPRSFPETLPPVEYAAGSRCAGPT
jgi:transposase InsO family protein